jgi:hypothetical protein
VEGVRVESSLWEYVERIGDELKRQILLVDEVRREYQRERAQFSPSSDSDEMVPSPSSPECPIIEREWKIRIVNPTNLGCE